eukprot:1092922-Pleurochrysis_carterae.AAC.2
MAADPRLQQMMQSMSQDPRMQGVMNNVIADMTFISTELKPDAADPDAEVSFASIIRTLCAVPSLKELGDDAETTEQVLSALQEHEAIDKAAIDGLEGTARRNVVLLYWQLNRQRKALADAVTLDEKTQKQASEVLRAITKLLLQSQMMMPQQRWIQQTLAVARASALVANSLWSHTDDEALALQRDILKGDGLHYPDVELKANARPKEAPDVESEVPCQVFPGKHVSLRVVVNRKHAGPSEGVQQLNQQGVLEAYWLYIEGQKPKVRDATTALARWCRRRLARTHQRTPTESY